MGQSSSIYRALASSTEHSPQGGLSGPALTKLWPTGKVQDLLTDRAPNLLLTVEIQHLGTRWGG